MASAGWEAEATLSDGQLEDLLTLSSMVEERPMHMVALENGEAKGALSQVPETTDGGADVNGAQRFYDWLGDVEDKLNEEKEEKFTEYVDLIGQFCKLYDDLLSKVNETKGLLTSLEENFHAVSHTTNDLHDNCESLLTEKKRLVTAADSIRERLTYFDDLETLGTELQRPSVSVHEEDFLPNLQKLDECITYIAKHPDYLDTNTYLVKARLLQARGLALIKNYFVRNMRSTTQAVMVKLKMEKEGVGKDVDANDESTITPATDEETALYVMFRTAAPELKALMNEIESRSQGEKYAALLSDCYRCYFNDRQLVLTPVVQEYFSGLEEKCSLGELLRHGCMYFARLCQQEHNLLTHFFDTEKMDKAEKEYLESLCSILYDCVRPYVIHLDDIDLLVEIVDILRLEILEDFLETKGDDVVAMKPVVVRIVQDVQERLTYRAQTYIRDNIRAYFPDAGSVDYPNKLIQVRTPRSSPPISRHGSVAENLSGRRGSAGNVTITEVGGTAEAEKSEEGGNASNENEGHPDSGETSPAPAPLSVPATHQPDDLTPKSSSRYSLWYPTLERTLFMLSKLYRCLDITIFEGLAMEAVSVCTQSLIQASKIISKEKSPDDGYLFLIKHLLILREQIAPFDVDFSITERTLDFTDMKGAFLGLIYKPPWTTSGSLIDLFMKGAPRVLDHHVDSKKVLEAELKKSCESYILHVTQESAEPLLNFIAKYTSLTTNSGPLKDQAFIKQDAVKDVVNKMVESINKVLPDKIESISLYLANAVTQSILFKPIKTNIVEAYGQLVSAVNQAYTLEEKMELGIPSKQDVTKMLDELG